MDLYTLTNTFLADTNVEEFISAIWTERYSTAGEVQIVTADTIDNRALLADGTLLACRGSDKIMMLETQSTEANVLTVVGIDLLEWLNQRQAWFVNPPDATTDSESAVADLTLDTMKPGEFISHVVDISVINPVLFSGDRVNANLQWVDEVIPGLSLGPIDTSGVAERLTATIGPLYDSIAQVAQKEGVGISLYLASADPVIGFSLKFMTYRGKDRTSGQSVNELIRLSPQFESISGVKEVRSQSEYKNVAYVFYENKITMFLADPSQPAPEGFDRRVLLTNAEGEPVGRKQTPPSWQFLTPGYDYSQPVVGEAEKAEFVAQNGKDALANHNYIHAMDGQTSLQSEFQFGRDYGLGDIIELQAPSGLINNARITEYIRAQDQTGDKEYPTISVL